ncbi:hypothetical protein D3C87_1086830 [compost metagenome]
MSLVTEKELIESLLATLPPDEAKEAFDRARTAAGIPSKESYDPADVISISSAMLNDLHEQANLLFGEIEAGLK